LVSYQIENSEDFVSDFERARLQPRRNRLPHMGFRPCGTVLLACMPFSDFHGNADVVKVVRSMLARDHFPHAVIISGPEGSGKYTLAQMIAKAMNCQNPPLTGEPDFCGQCENCLEIAQADDLDSRFAEAVETRDGLRDTDKKETRIFVQTHPDVLVIPPDPPQMMIKVDQVRYVIGQMYKRPRKGDHAVYIFTDSAFMKEAANSLLKVLEEPPEFATIFLLTTNPGEFLPTIRSRCITLQLAPLSPQELEDYLAKNKPEWNSTTRSLVSRLCGGACGKATSFDLERYTAARKDALTLLASAINPEDHSPLFRMTETYRAGAEGKEKTDQLLRASYSILEDLLFLKEGGPKLVRNSDILPDLSRLAASIDFAWITAAASRLHEVESGMRRNVLRSLSLDAVATSLER
jgi:DNA polymerase III subunit delta'